MRSVIDIVDLTVEEIDELIQTVLDIIANPEKYNEICRHKKLATLFYEPSTRTRLSFETAMLDLGGNVIGFSDPNSTSASKGESVADTTKIVSGYADIIAMRSPKEGAALVASLNASIPVINAGDGSHFHPTQTLADLLTIYREKGTFDNLTIGFCGDLKYGRTVHSLIAALSRYKNVKLVLISPDELKIPSHVIDDVINPNHMEYVETRSLEEALPSLDVLYMTRVQGERFLDKDEYERLKNSYVLDVERMKLAKKDTIVLHPLPRVNEISVKVDDDPRALYFKQAVNGKFMRMALILKLLKEAEKDKTKRKLNPDGLIINQYKCTNVKCISQSEQELDQICRIPDLRSGIKRCIYCDHEVF